jgi:Atypical PilZ domain, cyclic di-GMP receptor
MIIQESGLITFRELTMVWQLLADGMTEEAAYHINQVNTEFIHTYNILEDRGSSLSFSGSDSDDVHKKISHLEAKLDLLIQMIGKNLFNHMGLPGRLPVKLGVHTIEWEVDISSASQYDGIPLPAIDEIHLLTVYLLENNPFHLLLPVHIQWIKKAGNRNIINAEYSNITRNVQELLETFIFRVHRRDIALTRQAK